MQKIILFLSIFLISLLGMLYPSALLWVAIVSFLGLIYMLWKYTRKGFKPKSSTYKELERIKKKRSKIEKNKYRYINDQIAYISTKWGYTKEQEKIIEKFVNERAYNKIYNKLSASLFPQLITLVDRCNDREKKGCKREVSRRINELIYLMKVELKENKIKNNDIFDTTLKVYDQLLKK